VNTAGTTRLSFLSRLRQSGDRRSWGEFHKYYGEVLFRYARRLGASASDAEDVVQEVEMYVFRAIECFEHPSRKGCFRAYLRSAVKHAVARRTSRQAGQEVHLDPHVLDTLAQEDAGQDPAWEREYHLHRLRWAIRSIAREFEPTTLEAFRLYALANRSASETAEQLGLTKESVYQAKSRVLKRLQERISSLDSDVVLYP
jgi:RNA polymerase sigma-70 factor (ECF subfamily)